MSQGDITFNGCQFTDHSDRQLNWVCIRTVRLKVIINSTITRQFILCLFFFDAPTSQQMQRKTIKHYREEKLGSSFQSVLYTFLIWGTKCLKTFGTVSTEVMFGLDLATFLTLIVLCTLLSCIIVTNQRCVA